MTGNSPDITWSLFGDTGFWPGSWWLAFQNWWNPL